jgi:hypothetical protein
MGDCGVGVAPAMDDFAFKVNFIAVVRVRANDKSVAARSFLRSLERLAPLKSAWPIRAMLWRAITQR